MAAAVSETRGVRVHPDVAWTGDRQRATLVLVSDPGAIPVVLSDVAAAIWIGICVDRSHSHLVAGLAAEFGADVAEVASDVDDFVEECIRLGVLTRT